MRRPLTSVLRALAKERGHFNRCPACGKPILLEDTVVRYLGRAHHEACAKPRK